MYTLFRFKFQRQHKQHSYGSLFSLCVDLTRQNNVFLETTFHAVLSSVFALHLSFRLMFAFRLN